MVIGASVRLFEEIASYDRAFFNFFVPVRGPETWTMMKSASCCAGARRWRGTAKVSGSACRDEGQGAGDHLHDRRESAAGGYAVRCAAGARDGPGGASAAGDGGRLTPLLKHVLTTCPEPEQTIGCADSPARSRIAERDRETGAAAAEVVYRTARQIAEGRFLASEGEGRAVRPRTGYRIRCFAPGTRCVICAPRAGGGTVCGVQSARGFRWRAAEFLDDKWREFGTGRRLAGGGAIDPDYRPPSRTSRSSGGTSSICRSHGEGRQEHEAAMLLAESEDGRVN